MYSNEPQEIKYGCVGSHVLVSVLPARTAIETQKPISWLGICKPKQQTENSVNPTMLNGMAIRMCTDGPGLLHKETLFYIFNVQYIMNIIHVYVSKHIASA